MFEWCMPAPDDSWRIWSSQTNGGGKGRRHSRCKGLEEWKSTPCVGNGMCLCVARLGLHRLFPQKHRKLNTSQVSPPLCPLVAPGCQGKVVPVHCCSMAWTWASVNSQQYASFFHSWGCRYLEASRHSTERNCSVSCRWSCLKVKLFLEGSPGSLQERWSCGADPHSASAIWGKSLPGSPLWSWTGNWDWHHYGSRAYCPLLWPLCLALTSGT